MPQEGVRNATIGKEVSISLSQSLSAGVKSCWGLEHAVNYDIRR
jgi:hypothetical protein